jgi:hypothetical protein
MTTNAPVDKVATTSSACSLTPSNCSGWPAPCAFNGMLDLVEL